MMTNLFIIGRSALIIWNFLIITVLDEISSIKNFVEMFDYEKCFSSKTNLIFFNLLLLLIRGISGLGFSRFFPSMKRRIGLIHFYRFSKTHKCIINPGMYNRLVFRLSFGLQIIIAFFLVIFVNNYPKFVELKTAISIVKKYSKDFKIANNILFGPHLFGNGVLKCDNDNIDQGRSYSQMNIDISHCFFSRSTTFFGHGGVIYINAGDFSMNVNYSMFYNCTCTAHGGAIRFSSTKSSIRMICAFRCICGDNAYGHFAYITTSQENQVEFLSVSFCSNCASGCYPIDLYNGKQSIDNTNSSMNNAKRGSGVCIESPSSFTSSFCTFSNNMVSDWACIYFSSKYGKILMLYTNIVNNSSQNNLVILVD